MDYDFKVVVAGPFASGKTTMINASSDDPLVGTEAPTSGDEAAVKAMTTVGLEFGTLRYEEDGATVELNIYGVPGQKRFSFMWDIVSVGMDGFFLLVDASRPETWSNSLEIGEYFAPLSTCPLVVGINRATNDAVVDEIRQSVSIPGAVYLTFDVMDSISAQNALMELLLLMLEEELGEPALVEAS